VPLHFLDRSFEEKLDAFGNNIEASSCGTSQRMARTGSNCLVSFEAMMIVADKEEFILIISGKRVT